MCNNTKYHVVQYFWYNYHMVRRFGWHQFQQNTLMVLFNNKTVYMVLFSKTIYMMLQIADVALV